MFSLQRSEEKSMGPSIRPYITTNPLSRVRRWDASQLPAERPLMRAQDQTTSNVYLAPTLKTPHGRRGERQNTADGQRRRVHRRGRGEHPRERPAPEREDHGGALRLLPEPLRPRRLRLRDMGGHLPPAPRFRRLPGLPQKEGGHVPRKDRLPLRDQLRRQRGLDIPVALRAGHPVPRPHVRAPRIPHRSLPQARHRERRAPQGGEALRPPPLQRLPGMDHRRPHSQRGRRPGQHQLGRPRTRRGHLDRGDYSRRGHPDAAEHSYSRRCRLRPRHRLGPGRDHR